MNLDLHEANILLRLPNTIDDLTPDQIYERYGQPTLEEVERVDGRPLDHWVPDNGVVPIWLGGRGDKLSLADSQIFLNDFGESFLPGSHVRKSSHTPLMLRPPEILLDPVSQFSFPAELWSLGCAVFSIMGQSLLFYEWFPSNDQVLEYQVAALGQLPQDLWLRWANRSQYCDDQLRSLRGLDYQSLEDLLEKSIQEPRNKNKVVMMDEEEKQSFVKLMRLMLAFRPDERPSAQQVLESHWVQNWAIPTMGLIDDGLVH